MLKAVFYARFHPERGISVIHQYPNGSIIPSTPATARSPLIPFADISAYIIPPYELCNRSFSICFNGHRVLGVPVSLEDARYSRNRFTFSVCFVLGEDERDAYRWDRLVRKTAVFFTSLEEEDGFLSIEEELEGLRWAGEDAYPVANIGIVYPVLQAVVEDLNTYHETCVHVSDRHVLNLRLDTQVQRPPPVVRPWDVPLIIRELPSPDQWTWDLTLQRIHPHIDGINHIKRIAELADVELKLVQRGVRNLLSHDRILLLDIFHFQAIYTLTRDFAWFVQDADMQAKCRTYIAVNPAENPLSTSGKPNSIAEQLPAPNIIIDLYSTLTPGLTLHDFTLAHQPQLTNIDIRRLITFGVIKGFLRRVHKYALALSPSTSITPAFANPSPSKSSKPKSNEAAVREIDKARKKAALSSGWATPPAEPPLSLLSSFGVEVGSARSAEEVRTEEDERLRGFLDGRHCLDEVCVEMGIAERKVVERVRSGRFGEVVVFGM